MQGHPRQRLDGLGQLPTYSTLVPLPCPLLLSTSCSSVPTKFEQIFQFGLHKPTLPIKFQQPTTTAD